VCSSDLVSLAVQEIKHFPAKSTYRVQLDDIATELLVVHDFRQCICEWIVVHGIIRIS